MRFLSYMSTPTGRVLRVLLGAVIIAVGVALDGGIGTGLIVFGFLPPLTGILGICPLNPLVGRPIRCDQACRMAASAD